MIKIYGMLQSRALRPLWAAEEAGGDYEFHPVNMSNGEHHEEWFKSMNPCGKVPVMTDGDFTLFESPAICEYIAEQSPGSGLLPLPGTKERALYNQWMYFTVTELEQPLWLLAKHKFALPEEYRLPDVSKTAFYEFDKAGAILARPLESSPWLLGETFSLADIMAGQTILWAFKYDVPVENKTLKEYAGRLKSRPAFQKVISKFR